MDSHPFDTGRCVQTGTLLYSPSHWSYSSGDGRYRTQLGVSGQMVFTRSHGEPAWEDIQAMLRILREISVREGLSDRGWVMVSEFTGLKSTGIAARRLYIEEIRAMPGLRGLSIHGATGIMKLAVRMGKALYTTPFPVQVNDSVDSAVQQALCWLEGSGHGPLELLSGTEGTRSRSDGVARLVELLSEIEWDRKGGQSLEMFPASDRWKPVVDGLLVIKRDLDNLLEERWRRRTELQDKMRREEELHRRLSESLSDSERLKSAFESESQRNLALTQEMVDAQKEMLFALGEVIESRSRETANHIRRVSEYSYELALCLGYTQKEAEYLRHAAPMHDAGKIAIPDSILNKPGRLTPEEMEIMKTHAQRGWELLRVSDREILQVAAIIAYEHHEKWDGSGYPRGLKGEEIHPWGRITALVDVFDALGSDRCYKKAWPMDRVLSLIQDERGKHFEPRTVDAFFEHLDTFIGIRARFPDAPPG